MTQKKQAWLNWCAGLSITFIILVVGAYLYKFSTHSWSKDPGSWADFGGYVGGVISPLFGLITIWLLAATLRQNVVAMNSSTSTIEDQSDLVLAASLLGFYVHQLEYNKELMREAESAVPPDPTRIRILERDSQNYIERKQQIEQALKKEHTRLVDKFNSDKP